MFTKTLELSKFYTCFYLDYADDFSNITEGGLTQSIFHKNSWDFALLFALKQKVLLLEAKQFCFDPVVQLDWLDDSTLGDGKVTIVSL